MLITNLSVSLRTSSKIVTHLLYLHATSNFNMHVFGKIVRDLYSGVSFHVAIKAISPLFLSFVFRPPGTFNLSYPLSFSVHELMIE